MGRTTEAWHQLSKQAQDELLGKVNGALAEVGGKRIINCNSYWASEEWVFFGVEESPTIETVQAHAKLLAGLNWHRYVKTTTLLGTEWDES
jgi:hypothetical protein